MLFMLELFLFFWGGHLSPASSFFPKMLHTNWTITVEKSEHTMSHMLSVCVTCIQRLSCKEEATTFDHSCLLFAQLEVVFPLHRQLSCLTT